jgi:hypothetical protein
MACADLTFSTATTHTFSGNVTVSDDLLVNTGSVVLNGAFNISVSGDMTFTSYGISSGTMTVEYVGTGVWSSNTSVGIGCNLNINTDGTLTKSGNTRFLGANLTLTKGTVSGGYLDVASACTIITVGAYNIGDIRTMAAINITLGSDINCEDLFLAYDHTLSGAYTIYCANYYMNGGKTVALSGDIHCSTQFTIQNAGTATLNGHSVYVGEDLEIQASSLMAGTTGIIMDGTGALKSLSTSSMVSNDITINTAGTITIGTYFVYGAGTFTYTSGTVVSSGSTLYLKSTAGLNTSGITWQDVVASTGTSVLASALIAAGNLTISAGAELSCAGFSVTVRGNFTKSATGTYTHGNNNTIFDGDSVVAGSVGFYDLTVNAGKEIHLTAGESFAVAGTFNAVGSA